MSDSDLIQKLFVAQQGMVMALFLALSQKGLVSFKEFEVELTEIRERFPNDPVINQVFDVVLKSLQPLGDELSPEDRQQLYQMLFGQSGQSDPPG